MIRYSLSCAQGHDFESWFANAGAFEALARAGQLSCPLCGVTQVGKALMAPAVRPARKAKAREAEALTRASGAGSSGAGASGAGAGSRGAPPDRPGGNLPPGPQAEIAQAIAELRRRIEENSEYVGADFAAEARRIHDGEAQERAIHGEARPDEARRLIEDGIPVTPLPFLSTRKVN